MNLFTAGPFTAHSGAELPFKIDCDMLTDADLATLAAQVADKIAFCRVVGIPRGGVRFAMALQHHFSGDCIDGVPVLIVDDVLTTGGSMEEWRKKTIEVYDRDEGIIPNVIGVVIFARGPCPYWVQPIFQLCAPWR